MILLFGNKANKQNSMTKASTSKTNQIKNNPVENSGILAMTPSVAKGLLTMGEYDTYIFSNPTVINYAAYANYESSSEDCGFMSDFSAAVAVLSDGGFSGGFGDCGCSCSNSSCSSFSSVG